LKSDRGGDTMTRVMRLLAGTATLVCTLNAALLAQWTQFRGPDGTGVVGARGLPIAWSETTHVRWKTSIHGRAWSSPIVLGPTIWLTTATEDGRQLFVIAVDSETGRVVRDVKLFDVASPQYAHPFNTYASPTPVAEPGRVCVTFGSPGTACLESETGRVLWTRRDLACNHYRGAGSSPILFGDLLIMHFDGSDQQYVVALDKRTGATRWKTSRSIDFKDLRPDGTPEAEGDLRKAFATPHIVQVSGRPVLVSSGAKAHYGYDPSTGKELWRVEDRQAHSAATRPVAGFGLVFVPTGFPKGDLIAIRPDGRGDVTSSHVAWRLARGVPNKPSLVLLDDLIYMVSDAGIASCVEARTGQVVWTARIGGTYSASPIAADGHVYFFSEDGVTTVVEAGRMFKQLAQSQLGDGFLASPAVAGKALILRSRTHLYRIE
jgi:outer membrane protein assembly factor BamB